MMNFRICFFLLISAFALLVSCNTNETEKYQKERNKVLTVASKLHKITLGDLMIGSNARVFIMGDVFIVQDNDSYTKQIHLFHKKDYTYITSFGRKGEGPNEITNMGHIAVDGAHHKLYVSDHGKQKIFSYDVDSLIHDSLYVPSVKWSMNIESFPADYDYYSDTLSVGRVIQPIGNNDYKPIVAKINFKKNVFTLMPYEHPNIKKNRFSYASSLEDDVYVQCYSYYDLMTICSLNGKLKYNVYGPMWDERSSKVKFFHKVIIANGKVLALYSGKRLGIRESPTMFQAFDLNGDYLYTADLGYEIIDFCYDKDNNRLILVLDDEDFQFAYLNLSDLRYE